MVLCMCHSTHEEIRGQLWSEFSPSSSLWVVGLSSGHQTCTASALPVEESPHAGAGTRLSSSGLPGTGETARLAGLVSRFGSSEERDGWVQGNL